MAVIPPAPPPATVEPNRLTITLPVPPSINHQYATVNGRRILSAAGRRYKLEIGQQILIALAHSSNKQSLLKAALGLCRAVDSLPFHVASSTRY
jgi:hypothetical protein